MFLDKSVFKININQYKKNNLINLNTPDQHSLVIITLLWAWTLALVVQSIAERLPYLPLQAAVLFSELLNELLESEPLPVLVLQRSLPVLALARGDFNIFVASLRNQAIVDFH